MYSIQTKDLTKNYGKVTADQIQKIVKEYRPDGEGKSHGKD